MLSRAIFARLLPLAFVTLLFLLLGSCVNPASGEGGTPAPLRTAPAETATRVTSVIRWIASSQRPTGAILTNATGSHIVPYFANHAAWGLAAHRVESQAIRNYVLWYFSHLNKPDRWGRMGTVYDYEVVNGQEVPANDYDSADAYAGTFLTVLRAWYEADPAAAQPLLASHLADIEMIADLISQLQQTDGLTWAKDTFRVKYLLDNVETYAGLRDLTMIGPAIGLAPGKNARIQAAADAIQRGINQALWQPTLGFYLAGLDQNNAWFTTRLNVWYPDAIAQLSMITNRVPTRIPYRQLYDRFKQFQPGWFNLDQMRNFRRIGDRDIVQFPFAMVGYAARLVGDDAAWTTYHENAFLRYLTGPQAFAWPWNTGEAGYYLMMNLPAVPPWPDLLFTPAQAATPTGR
jgi:hypothetical protein